MPTQKIDPKVIFASNAPAIDKPPVFSDKTKGWDAARANDGRPQIKEMNKLQQDTDLKILWLNENAVLPYDASVDYPDGAVTLKDGSFKQLSSGSWVEFLDDFADKDAVKRGIANRYDSSLTYNSGERVVLANGDIVKSTIPNNINDPNVDMTGWAPDFDTSAIQAEISTINTELSLKADKTYVDNQDALKADKTYVDTALSSLSTDATKFYPTLALANADIANLAANQPVTIGESANGGLWYKATAGATSLTKSAYDPLTQAKADATTKANAAEANANTYTNEEIKKVVEFAPLDLASAVLDDNGFAITYVGKDGTSHASDFITPEGSLSEALELAHLVNQVEAKKLASVTTDGNGTILFGVNTDATIESPYPPIQGFGVDAIRSQMLPKEKLNAAGLYLDKVSSDHLSPMKWEVMVAPHATDGMGHCRMGSMYQLSPTKFYVAFTQFKTAGTDQEGGRLVARFVDVDFTNKTSVVGETRVIYDGIPNLEHPPAQPQFFKVKDGVILIFNQDHDLVTYKSTDGCLTWTEIGRYSPSPRTFWLALDGVIQIPNGIYKDRIVAAGFAWAVNGTSSMFLRSMYSDDFGITWQVGYDFDPVTIGLSKSMNETGITVDTNNDLIFIVRNEAGTGERDTTTGKTFFKSTDGGKTVTRFYPDTPFIAAVCQTGIFQFAQNPWEGVPKIITTAPRNVGARDGLKMRISYDNMKSTAWEYNIYPTSLVTGYTSIKQVSPHMLGIVCEYGGFNAVSNVVINFINFKEIFNGSTI